jgi:hypothetical protein
VKGLFRYAFCFQFILLMASTVTAQQAKSAPGPPASQFDLFVGYTWWMPNSPIRGDHLSNSRQGIIVTGAYYLKPGLGIELSGDYHVAAGNDSMRSVAIGPILRLPVPNHFTIFAHALGGAAEFLIPGSLPPAWGPQFTIGGGLDWAVPFFGHRLTLRLLQADYVYEYFHYGGPESFVSNVNLNSLRLDSGIVIKMGSVAAPAPVTLTCTAVPQNVLHGELLTVTGEANNLHRHRGATFRWAGSGVGVGESNSAVTVDTAGLEPGTYRISGRVSEGARAGQSANCIAQFKVMAIQR